MVNQYSNQKVQFWSHYQHLTRRRRAYANLHLPEMLLAVRSLYADDLKPFGRVLLKRLRERAAVKVALEEGLDVDAVDPESMPRINPVHLRKFCTSCKDFIVKPEECKEYSVLLLGQPHAFLDVRSPADHYSESLWDDLAAFFDNLEPEDKGLPGGRYACAQALRKYSLSCLDGCSLGQVCHIVELAISHKRLLGYRDSQLVPYKFSDTWAKEQLASVQTPESADRIQGQGLQVASWEDLRTCLLSMLTSQAHCEVWGIPVSSVKERLRKDFGLELSVTALGYIKVMEVLTDPYLRDTCCVLRGTNGELTVYLGTVYLECPGFWSSYTSEMSNVTTWEVSPNQLVFEPSAFQQRHTYKTQEEYGSYLASQQLVASVGGFDDSCYPEPFVDSIDATEFSDGQALELPPCAFWAGCEEL